MSSIYNEKKTNIESHIDDKTCQILLVEFALQKTQSPIQSNLMESSHMAYNATPLEKTCRKANWSCSFECKTNSVNPTIMHVATGNMKLRFNCTFGFRRQSCVRPTLLILIISQRSFVCSDIWSRVCIRYTLSLVRCFTQFSMFVIIKFR